jgi:hypothetical protein
VPRAGRSRTFHLLLSGHVEERLEVLTELLFLWGRRLAAGTEKQGHRGEVLGGLFGNESPVNVADDTTMYLLCALTRGHCRSLCAEYVVEPRLLVHETLLSLIKLVEASTLLLAVGLILQGFLASGGIGRSGLSFRGALVGVGGVDRVNLLLEDEALAPQVVGCRRLLAKGRALGLVTACLRCLQGDQSCVSCAGGSSRPAAGELRLPLRVHKVVAELELVPG